MSRYDIHIQISGVPGAGKTTLLKLIAHHLTQYGHPVTLRDAGYPSELSQRVMPVEGPVLGRITLSTQRVGDQELEQLLRSPISMGSTTRARRSRLKYSASPRVSSNATTSPQTRSPAFQCPWAINKQPLAYRLRSTTESSWGLSLSISADSSYALMP